MRLAAHRDVRRICRKLALASMALVVDATAPAAAQQAGPHATDTPSIIAIDGINTPAEARTRLLQLEGADAEGFLIRSPSSLLPNDSSGRSLSVLVPELRLHWNSAVPFSANDGALWAGRGLSSQLTIGAVFSAGPLRLVVAPQISYSRNEEFTLLPDSLTRPSASRSMFVAPWFATGRSIDMPLRFGDSPYAMIDPGQSSLTVTAGGVAVGGATENQWWGPGVRNALVLSNNAAGFPHLFVRTAGPIRTRIGEIDGKYLLGGLSESPFFEIESPTSVRSLGGAVVTLSPAPVPELTVGVTRVVYAGADGAAGVLANAADFLTSWERRPAAFVADWSPEKQQIIALFGRWLLPRSGFEVYTEWARHELPVSARDLLASPNHTQAYTVGIGWAGNHRFGRTKLEAESTFLEYSPTFRRRPYDAIYTSRTVPQGYTHRGQVVGAAIGPGSSNLWLAVDQYGERYQAGIYLNRVRWQAGELQRSIPENRYRIFRSFHAWDTSLIGGLRAGLRVGHLWVSAEAALEQRYNFLFQNPDRGYGPEGAVDVRNGQIRLMLSGAPRPLP